MDREKDVSLALVSKLDREGWSSSVKKARKDGGGDGGEEGVLNVRKAVRYASKGRGAASMVSKRGGRGGKGKR